MNDNRKDQPKTILKPEIYSLYLPHGPEWQYLDEVHILNNTEAVGLVTVTNQHCLGHFPGNPVLPGVLQLECFGQTLAVLAQAVHGRRKGGFYREADAVFRTPVLPGDKLELYVTMSTVRFPLVKGAGHAKVGETVVSNAKMISLAIS